jgi:hypothetical protein
VNDSRSVTVITLSLAVVTCVAAILVVPEVRCGLGLEKDKALHGARCVPRNVRPGPAGPQPFLSGSADAAALEFIIGRIRATFESVERDRGQYATLRKEIRGLGADSAYATIYSTSSTIPKIRARLFSGALRTSIQAYYDGGELVFVYQTISQIFPSGEREIEQQRFYFSGGRLVRWLDASRSDVPRGGRDFAANERRLSLMATELMEQARSSGSLIVLDD